MAELLLEIFSEEIPARMQLRAAEDLKRLVTDGLKAAGLAWTRADAYVTPRRLALVVDGLPLEHTPKPTEVKGPRPGAPATANVGFVTKLGVPQDLVPGTAARMTELAFGQSFVVKVSSDLEIQFALAGSEKGGQFYAATPIKAGRPTPQIISQVIEGVLSNFPWPKSMRWGDGAPMQWKSTDGQPVSWTNSQGQPVNWKGSVRWVRPLHGIVCLFGGAVVPVEFAGITAGNTTQGHRFLAPAPITVTSFADYAAKLRAGLVLLDQAERRALIDKATHEAAARLGLTVRPDPGLLDEVTGLVEWPVVLTGMIDAPFMAVPQEVLITAMRAHQKYFALLDKSGKLAARFLVVANMETKDGGAAIVAGNERVLRARLSDARFFWEQDKKTRLELRVDKLAERTFFEGLGTVADKVNRVRTLARLFALHAKCDADLADRAALLAKADLVTEMVGEFPELQGIMGRYYAANDGETGEVAQAIAEHYKPQGPDDTVPSAPVSVAVALADKFDTLAGFFAIGEKPTGSKDPFALRRAGIGIIRLILDNKVRVMLWTMIQRAVAAYGKNAPNAGKEILDFILDRLKVHLREQGARHDLIAAATGRAEDDLVRLVARINALADFLATDDGANLLTAYRRAANILRIEEGKDGKRYAGDTDAALFALPQEKALAEAIVATEEQSSTARSAEDFAGAMAALARLRAPVDAFFDKVTVNADDAALRENRLKLLSGITKAMDRVADFSKVEG